MKIWYHQIWVAISLVMVIEGIWPFLDPTGLRQALLKFAEQEDEVLRMSGLVSMIIGVLLLYLVNGI
jgi:hypothetical protein